MSGNRKEPTQTAGAPREAGADHLMRNDEVASRLRVSVATLSRWRRKGSGPPFVKLGAGRTAVIRYRARDVEEFIDRSMRHSTCDPGAEE